MPSSLPRLWKPNQVFWIGFLFGWPGAVVLACLDWLRIGRREKALWHMLGGLAAALVYTLGIWFIPDNTRILPLLVNILILFYLKDRLGCDLPPFDSGQYQPASIWRGILICLAALVVYLSAVFVLAFGLTMLEGI